MSVRRIYVEKRPEYAAEARALLKEIREILEIPRVTGVRVLNRYDVEGVDDALFERCLPVVFSEPQLDVIFEEIPTGSNCVLAVEYLPGQFDQRAASCEECIQLVGQGDRPTVRTAKIYLFSGEPTEEEMGKIRRHLINPVEAREAELAPKETLAEQYPEPEDVQILSGFRELKEEMLPPFVRQYGLAMDAADLCFCRDYFREEGRDPTLTEIRMIDTYWSDHCRHTTFLTQLDWAEIEKPEVREAFQRYLSLREEVYGEAAKTRPVTLMDMATIGAKALKKRGLTPNVDESEEINACSIRIEADVDGKKEPWLLMFKNETHNHPTEIEPFGGAATCIGGAIRDPLSGRAYVYQAMRVTGAANPLTPVSETIPGKLPQRKLCVTAAAGYSSYGNQIGLATGLVDEVYHPGYAAKRLEIGAVVGAAPLANVRRERPVPGDVVVLLGGRTGRDGIGGATGSSKSHKRTSLETCGAEVQKGNAPTERKLQRLFRNGEVSRLIKRCNDFGAGGVSVAIGELADGLLIDLDLVPRKYEGLDGTELAISESQERMAVVLSPEDVPAFLRAADGENLEATVVAHVTEEPRLRMTWRGKTIVDVSRNFLSSNGAEKHAAVRVLNMEIETPDGLVEPLQRRMEDLMGSLACCSRQGLAERFDSTIGAGTVLLPFGGKRMLSPSQTMVAKLPLLSGETETVSGMAYAFHPELLSQSPYEGSYLAVIESVAKLVAAGFDRKQTYLTLQEYFPRMTGKEERWGMPFAALLGALDAEMALGTAAIGGKDSMSGTFENLDVPPTLCSFAVAPGQAGDVISAEFKQVGSEIRLCAADPFDGSAYSTMLDEVHAAIQRGEVLSAWAVGLSLAEGLFKMGLGNAIGVRIDAGTDLFVPRVGAILLECGAGCSVGERIGVTIPEWKMIAGTEICDLALVQERYESKLESVFPYRGHTGETTETLSDFAKPMLFPSLGIAKPRAFIPVFPGTNCEVDTARALERAGGRADIFVINNLTPDAITESIREAAGRIRESQMIILPGGFSGGDEPDGSAKFITAFFRNPAMQEAVTELMEHRGGLMLGICNGFQALVKLGLVPFGRIVDTNDTCPTLTYNEIGRHQSMAVRTRVSSVKSPWLSHCQVGDIHTVAVSHGEGRFVGPEALLQKLAENGQVATQYVNVAGNASLDTRCNPNFSMLAIEGITSPDGRILGKMGHSERSGRFLYKNAPGSLYQPLFEGGVDYFR
ncbi:MAG: phosphoribosylformylglycinamidine synthase [Clostridiales bacterium]|nr:phosphoribosylformylglycinamidine synthase [Clostridiales bacterium]